jgi:hypothetical protein
MTMDNEYRDLLELLKYVERELRHSFDAPNADALATAQKFAVGSPSEFLGESRIALQGALLSHARLDDATRQRIRRMIEMIDEGFRRIGGG